MLGFVEAMNGSKVATLVGKWDDSMYFSFGDEILKTKSSVSTENANLLWKRNKPPTEPTRYNLTSFAITLNELTSELKVDMRCNLLVKYHIFILLI